MDDREFSNVYTIPPNYTDSGKLLGGMLETRNTIEAVFLLLLVGYPELMWMHLPVTAKVVVMTMTLLPMGVFALMGIGGDSLLQFATHIVLFWMRRRQLHYGRSILNNSKTKIILNLEPDEAEYVKDVLKLTRTEIRSITQFERGEALISSNSNKVPVIIKASREEQQMITTDRAELEAMLNELKAVASVAEQENIQCEDSGEGGKPCRQFNFIHITGWHLRI